MPVRLRRRERRGGGGVSQRAPVRVAQPTLYHEHVQRVRVLAWYKRGAAWLACRCTRAMWSSIRVHHEERAKNTRPPPSLFRRWHRTFRACSHLNGRPRDGGAPQRIAQAVQILLSRTNVRIARRRQSKQLSMHSGTNGSELKLFTREFPKSCVAPSVSSRRAHLSTYFTAQHR